MKKILANLLAKELGEGGGVGACDQNVKLAQPCGVKHRILTEEDDDNILCINRTPQL